jgi:Bardet-Biedl syndrome 1 protein
MPSEIIAIVKMDQNRTEQAQNFLVGLRTGEIRMFNGKNLIDKLQTDDVCNGICFGIFGREEGCLLINTKSGGFTAKILQRQARLTVSSIRPGPPPE